MEMRAKKKVFNATNETGYYCCVIFSCAADLKTFVNQLHLKNSQSKHFLDGYEVATKFNLEPKRPSLKLPAPLDTSRMKD